MTESNVLQPNTTRQIIFYDDTLTAVLVDIENNSRIYVPIRPICEYLGLSWSGQLQRIRRDTILNEAALSVLITNPPGEGGGTQETICLPLELLNGWLFGVTVNRVRTELQEKLLRYRRECYRVLAAAFITTDLEPTSTAEQSSLIQIREMALAIAQMADQQLALTTRLDRAAIVVGEHGRRLTALEQQLAPRQAITDEQASDIAEKVKALALLLGEHDKSKAHFQSVFTELYRRFRVSSYKAIRQSQYHLVMDFLDEWLESIKTSDDNS